MISDEDIKHLFLNGQQMLAKHGAPTERLYSQFFRGKTVYNWEGQHKGACKRHLSVFSEFNIIPEYCFGCYKVLIEPDTVVELFKLMVIFEKLDFPNDNTRKCMVEAREQIPGTYKGMVYCRGLEEGRKVETMIRNAISQEISDTIPVKLKRGCSEYALSYPEFAKTAPEAALMNYKEGWHELEELADKTLNISTHHSVKDTNNQPAYTLTDAMVMLAWIRYAATIGDLSYLKISGRSMPPLQGLIRPELFHTSKEK